MNTQVMFVVCLLPCHLGAFYLLIVYQLCATRYRGFVYILSTVLLYFFYSARGCHWPEASPPSPGWLCFNVYLFFLSNETALAGGTSATVIRLTLQPIYCLRYCVANVLLFDDILLCYYTCCWTNPLLFGLVNDETWLNETPLQTTIRSIHSATNLNPWTRYHRCPMETVT